MLERLIDHIQRAPRLVVLTGAGVSAPSGIPTYRDDEGNWRRSDPILHQQFVTDASSRRRYWARSMSGWRFVRDSRPNPAHTALATLEQRGFVHLLVTQNVDRLHQRAGHREVVDLHGRIDRVTCLDCGAFQDRGELQGELERINPGFDRHVQAVRPDGDAEIEDRFLEGFLVPDCRACGGVLMPDVVFFGGSVPRARVDRVSRAVEAADAVLVAGSSLTVFSGFRICRQAAALGKNLLIVNRGKTRADELAQLKIEADCAEVLPQLVQQLQACGDAMVVEDDVQGTRPNPSSLSMRPRT